MLTKPKYLLHIEGALVFVAAILAYRYLQASWVLFFVLLLTPDLVMLGYLVGVRAGAVTYNIVHFYAAPALLLGCSLYLHYPVLLAYGLIWMAHIGMDRMLGFGLKYPTHFKDTHLQHV